MIILISGASHNGKTLLAQRLLEKLSYPYLSLDHLKMGFLRSGLAGYSVDDHDKITKTLWPVVSEMIKTAIENKQNMIIEGCYIPLDFAKSFNEEYLPYIKYYCLVSTADYLKENFALIGSTASIIECRLDDSDLSLERLIKCNAFFDNACAEHGLTKIYISQKYDVEKYADFIIKDITK